MGNRCVGHCCRDFTLSLSPQEIAAMPYRLDEKGQIIKTKEGIKGTYEDGEQLKGMLIYLGRYRHPKKRMRLPVLHQKGKTRRESEYHYTCKNLSASGNCAVYETRPGMCRDFPYKQACKYSGCQWTDARHGKA